MLRALKNIFFKTHVYCCDLKFLGHLSYKICYSLNNLTFSKIQLFLLFLYTSIFFKNIIRRGVYSIRVWQGTHLVFSLSKFSYKKGDPLSINTILRWPISDQRYGSVYRWRETAWDCDWAGDGSECIKHGCISERMLLPHHFLTLYLSNHFHSVFYIWLT